MKKILIILTLLVSASAFADFDSVPKEDKETYLISTLSKVLDQEGLVLVDGTLNIGEYKTRENISFSDNILKKIIPLSSYLTGNYGKIESVTFKAASATNPSKIYSGSTTLIMVQFLHDEVIEHEIRPYTQGAISSGSGKSTVIDIGLDDYGQVELKRKNSNVRIFLSL